MPLNRMYHCMLYPAFFKNAKNGHAIFVHKAIDMFILPVRLNSPIYSREIIP